MNSPCVSVCVCVCVENASSVFAPVLLLIAIRLFAFVQRSEWEETVKQFEDDLKCEHNERHHEHEVIQDKIVGMKVGERGRRQIDRDRDRWMDRLDREEEE